MWHSNRRSWTLRAKVGGEREQRRHWQHVRRDGADGLGRIGLEVDDMDFVVGHLLHVLAVLDHIDGVGDERDRAGGIDVEVDRRGRA